jgi:CheY-like chemotaxis protein
MPLTGLHILLAEDNPTNQMVAMQMLESLGATVSLAVDGVEALELASRERFDLGVIDIEMPRLSGTDVIRRLRAGPPPHSEMPLIALTAYVMNEHRAVIDEAGADGVIAKPILSIEQFGEDIRRIAEQRGPVGSSGGAGARAEAPEASGGPADHGSEEIDAAVLRTLAESLGEAAVRDLLEKVDADLLGVREALGAALPRLAPVPIREATHVLVAVAGTVGAMRLHHDAKCLNSAVHSGEMEAVERLGPVVISEIDSVREFIGTRLQG